MFPVNPYIIINPKLILIILVANWIVRLIFNNYFLRHLKSNFNKVYKEIGSPPLSTYLYDRDYKVTLEIIRTKIKNKELRKYKVIIISFLLIEAIGVLLLSWFAFLILYALIPWLYYSGKIQRKRYDLP